MARLDPPARFAAEHRRAVELLTAADRLRTDRALPFAERSRRGAEARRELRALQARIAATAAEDGERRYNDALAGALAERDDLYRRAGRDADAAGERVLAALAHMRVPADWSERHAELTRRLAEYVEASRRQHAQLDTSAEAPAVEFETAQTQLFDLLRQLQRQFRDDWNGAGAGADESADAHP